MTEVKIDPKLNKPMEKALAPHADDLLAAPLGTRVVAIVELAVVEHAEKGEGDDQVAHVAKIRPVLMEIATGDDAEHVRRALRALWTKRTSDGTLTGADDQERAEATLRFSADLIGGVE
ncbi:hypothetical protein [Nocardiopsis tropica]|uniref:Uncharacterized protein n=1 Tax=Nocardiopsis tropica TaxID=109330 RepID=A0ABU7KM15_9ACTN|nr:hypothetical protein [Nocardiopsis umidischolae]MEE2050330.1 hypothetical protein [Nocardiopsis umidischolae]